MSSVILFQQGDRCLDPKTNTYFDPWESHIYDCVKQIRIWNSDLQLYMIVDSDFNPPNYFINEYNVTIVKTESLKLDRDIESTSDYFLNDKNPLWRSSFVRFFYIEQLIKNENLTNIFTFDNDVLVYTNLSDLSNKMKKNFTNASITRISDDGVVCGMLWLKNVESIKILNDSLLELYSIPGNNKLSETILLDQVCRIYGNEVLDTLPIWYEGKLSSKLEEFDGFFDPGTIGQYLGGCHNGSPRGHIMTHHSLGPELLKFRGNKSNQILMKIDDHNRYFIAFKDAMTQKEFKLNSLHVHSKNLKEFMFTNIKD